MGCEIAVSNCRADADSSIRKHLHSGEGQPTYIDHHARVGHAEFHTVDQIRTASEKGGAGVFSHQGQRAVDILGASVLERHHDCTTCRIAATMLPYAAQRQRFPLMRSRISASSRSGSASRSSVT